MTSLHVARTTYHDMNAAPAEDDEREAFVALNPLGFFIRPPPPQHQLDAFQTPDELLFQAIHMGAAEVDVEKWKLVVTGLVEKPFALTLPQLRSLPAKSVTSFHECFGSPLKPATTALWRIGNVTWTGVPLHTLLAMAMPKAQATYVWSEGLDRGKFGGVEADRYQKDLPIEKALSPEVLVAYEMNSEPLSKNRGAPARLVVPGWFGTNSTKWLSKLMVSDRRAPGPFTTTFYNEHHPPDDPEIESRPIWNVQPNSMIIRPCSDSVLCGPEMTVEGWAWAHDGVDNVGVSVDEGETWTQAETEMRTEFSWQRFRARLELASRSYTVLARATSLEGKRQPLGEGRNHVHRVSIRVE